MFDIRVSRMKLPNGPMLFGGELATRPPHVNDGHRQHTRAVPHFRVDVVQDLIGQRVRGHDRRVGKDVGNAAHARP